MTCCSALGAILAGWRVLERFTTVPDIVYLEIFIQFCSGVLDTVLQWNANGFMTLSQLMFQQLVSLTLLESPYILCIVLLQRACGDDFAIMVRVSLQYGLDVSKILIIS